MSGTTAGARRRVAVLGGGAVGSYFGGMLARAGAEVTLIGRQGSTSAHLAAVERDGLAIDGIEVRETVEVAVARGGDAVAGADLVLFAVKSADTRSAARSIAPHLAGGALVVSLQNGIDNVDTMAEEGVTALPSVVFVAAEIERPGAVRHRGRGDLVLDAGAGSRQVAAVFEPAGVPCRLADDFASEQWTKLIINSMANAISALGGVPYRDIVRYPPAWELATRAAAEATTVATAAGVTVDLDAIVDTAREIALSIADATSSTEQDLSRGRPTEVEALNGAICDRGRRLGVATPTHDALRALVGLREHAQRREA